MHDMENNTRKGIQPQKEIHFLKNTKPFKVKDNYVANRTTQRNCDNTGCRSEKYVT